MKTTCDCIVPFYNEGLKPLEVINSLIKVKSISKIIAIDDGSSDNSTYLELKTKFPKVTTIKVKTNRGKAEAVKEGLKYVDAEYVFLVDGDLIGVISSEFDNTIQKIISNSNIDMIILPLVTELMKNDWFRVYVILSGQRILRVKDLQNIFKKNFSGFQVEVAINKYMIVKQKNVFWMPSSIHNPSKYKKWGLFHY
jgi:glycosyltransferase involved in cell wall biosynthesis